MAGYIEFDPERTDERYYDREYDRVYAETYAGAGGGDHRGYACEENQRSRGRTRNAGTAGGRKRKRAAMRAHKRNIFRRNIFRRNVFRRNVFRICLRNVFFVTVLVLMIFGGFRVQAMASDESSAQTKNVYSCVQIHSGDTLWSIAEDYCAEGASNEEIAGYVEDIRETNHIVNEYELHEGAWLVVYRKVPV